MRRAIAAASLSILISSCLWGQQTASTAAKAAAKPSAAVQPVAHAAAEPVAAQPAAKAKAPARHGRKKAAEKKPAAPPVATPAVAEEPPKPVWPATLANSEPVAPRVTLEGGLLTVEAPNSTLSEVLGAIQKATGATVEGAVSNERMAVRLGPADPRQVITALLRGTRYDYVILGSVERPNEVTRIVLRSADSVEGAEARPGGANHFGPESRPEPPGHNGPAFHQRPAQPPPDEAAEAEGEDAAAEPAQPEPPQQQPNSQQGPKTPEQLFRELQERNATKQ